MLLPAFQRPALNFDIMTVKELKDILNQFDDKLEVGGRGHFDEYLDINSVHISWYGFVALIIETLVMSLFSYILLWRDTITLQTQKTNA